MVSGSGTNNSHAFGAGGLYWIGNDSGPYGRFRPDRTLNLRNCAAFRASKKRLLGEPRSHRRNRPLRLVGEFWLLATRPDAERFGADHWDANHGGYILVHHGCDRFEFSGKKRFCEYGDYDYCRSGLASDHCFVAG